MELFSIALPVKNSLATVATAYSCHNEHSRCLRGRQDGEGTYVCIYVYASTCTAAISALYARRIVSEFGYGTCQDLSHLSDALSILEIRELFIRGANVNSTDAREGVN